MDWKDVKLSNWINAGFVIAMICITFIIVEINKKEEWRKIPERTKIGMVCPADGGYCMDLIEEIEDLQKKLRGIPSSDNLNCLAEFRRAIFFEKTYGENYSYSDTCMDNPYATPSMSGGVVGWRVDPQDWGNGSPKFCKKLPCKP